MFKDPIKNEDESASLVLEATAEMLISQVVEAKFYKQFILYSVPSKDPEGLALNSNCMFELVGCSPIQVIHPLPDKSNILHTSLAT